MKKGGEVMGRDGGVQIQNHHDNAQSDSPATERSGERNGPILYRLPQQAALGNNNQECWVPRRIFASKIINQKVLLTERVGLYGNALVVAGRRLL